MSGTFGPVNVGVEQADRRAHARRARSPGSRRRSSFPRRPLPLATAIRFFTPGMGIFSGGASGSGRHGGASILLCVRRPLNRACLQRGRAVLSTIGGRSRSAGQAPTLAHDRPHRRWQAHSLEPAVRQSAAQRQSICQRTFRQGRWRFATCRGPSTIECCALPGLRCNVGGSASMATTTTFPIPRWPRRVRLSAASIFC